MCSAAASIERRGVPRVDHHDPQEDRDDWVHERSQVAKAGRAQDRPEDGAGEPEGEQERCLVREDRVLDHVAEDEVVAQLVHGPDRRDRQQEKPAGEAQLARRGGRVPIAGQVRRTPVVGDAERQRQQEWEHGGHLHSPDA